MIKKILASGVVVGALALTHATNELHGDLERYESDYIPQREIDGEMIINDRLQTFQQNRVNFTQSERRELEKAPLR